MTKGGKQFLGVVFLLAAVGCVIAFIVAGNNYEKSDFNYQVGSTLDEVWGTASTEGPPEKPKPLIYFGAAGAFLVGAFVMFNMASADKTSRGLFSPPPPAPWEAEAAAKDGETSPDPEDPT